jgi:hypothetical protein
MTSEWVWKTPGTFAIRVPAKPEPAAPQQPVKYPVDSNPSTPQTPTPTTTSRKTWE